MQNTQSTVSRIYYLQVSRVFIVVTPTRRIAADFRPFSLATSNHPAKTEAVFFFCNNISNYASPLWTICSFNYFILCRTIQTHKSEYGRNETYGVEFSDDLKYDMATN